MSSLSDYITEEKGFSTSKEIMSKERINNDDNIYACTDYSYDIEILKIDENNNTITFNITNSIKNINQKLIKMPIKEYINLMEKNTYLSSKCSICGLGQNEKEGIPIFSYCIKCDEIICSECVSKHIEKNKEKHPNSSDIFIIQNNERGIKCLLHPTENNFEYCFECKAHLCEECLESSKHFMHRKCNLIEVQPNKKINEILKGIMSIYEIRLNKIKNEKSEKLSELYSEYERIVTDIKKYTKVKLKEIKKNYKNLLLVNEKEYINDLYILQLKYENEKKLKNKEYKIKMDKIKKSFNDLKVINKNICENKLVGEKNNYEKKRVCWNMIKK